MRGRSYTPSPPRGGYGRRGRSPSPRGRYGGRGGGRDLPTSLLVRNLRHDCRPEDLRRPFGQFGPLKDVYLPKDYYSGEPRGFGFVQYVDPADADEAKYHMDGSVFLGRQMTVVFAEENRKKPQDMRSRDRPRGRHYDRRRSPPPRYSRSPPPRYERSRSRSRGYYSPPPKRRQYSRSASPEEERRYSKERSYSHSPGYSGRGRSPVPDRSPPPYDNMVVLPGVEVPIEAVVLQDIQGGQRELNLLVPDQHLKFVCFVSDDYHSLLLNSFVFVLTLEFCEFLEFESLIV